MINIISNYFKIRENCRKAKLDYCLASVRIERADARLVGIHFYSGLSGEKREIEERKCFDIIYQDVGNLNKLKEEFDKYHWVYKIGLPDRVVVDYHGNFVSF
jgi:hypothetical protein